MRSTIRRTLVAVIGLFVAQFAVGHHSVSGQFDVTKTIILTGTVKRVDWVNPHIYIHLDVVENGKTETWRLGTVPVAMARRAGITKEALLAPGQTLKMSCYPARDGTQHLGFVFRIEYPDGHFIATNPDRA
jgi:Family of unknown function (DUF6152)